MKLRWPAPLVLALVFVLTACGPVVAPAAQPQPNGKARAALDVVGKGAAEPLTMAELKVLVSRGSKR
jgi:hypothetical protein